MVSNISVGNTFLFYQMYKKLWIVSSDLLVNYYLQPRKKRFFKDHLFVYNFHNIYYNSFAFFIHIFISVFFVLQKKNFYFAFFFFYYILLSFFFFFFFSLWFISFRPSFSFYPVLFYFKLILCFISFFRWFNLYYFFF